MNRISAFIHGANAMLCVTLLAAAALGPKHLTWAFIPPWPPWLTVLLSMIGLIGSLRAAAKRPETVLVIRRVCSNCDPEATRGAF